MSLVTTMATKKMGRVDKPTHVHSCRFIIINNYVNIIVIMYF